MENGEEGLYCSLFALYKTLRKLMPRLIETERRRDLGRYYVKVEQWKGGS